MKMIVIALLAANAGMINALTVSIFFRFKLRWLQFFSWPMMFQHIFLFSLSFTFYSVGLAVALSEHHGSTTLIVEILGLLGTAVSFAGLVVLLKRVSRGEVSVSLRRKRSNELMAK